MSKHDVEKSVIEWYEHEISSLREQLVRKERRVKELMEENVSIVKAQKAEFGTGCYHHPFWVSGTSHLSLFWVNKFDRLEARLEKGECWLQDLKDKVEQLTSLSFDKFDRHSARLKKIEEGDLEIHTGDWPHIGIVLTPRNIVDLLGGLYHRKVVKTADGEAIVDISYKVD